MEILDQKRTKCNVRERHGAAKYIKIIDRWRYGIVKKEQKLGGGDPSTKFTKKSLRFVM
jgi:hypothetical protein